MMAHISDIQLKWITEIVARLAREIVYVKNLAAARRLVWDQMRELRGMLDLFETDFPT